MNTKTMRLPPRRVLTPSNKRKERDGTPDTLTPSPKLPKPTDPQLGSAKPFLKPAQSNQLLAGYFAHEYLTKGTLFGQPWDPARAEAVLPGKAKPSHQKNSEAEPGEESHRRYREISSLLKSDGAHLPGVVNPTQLARLLQM